MAKTGRPSGLTKETADAVCSRLAKGESLRSIARDKGMPSVSMVLRWAESNEAFREQYARARGDGQDAIAEEILDIADDGRNDWVERENARGETHVVLDREHVERSKLRVDARKWLLSKLAPRKYGDKVTTELTGPNGGPVQFQTVADLARAMAAAPPSKPSEPPAAAEGAS